VSLILSISLCILDFLLITCWFCKLLVLELWQPCDPEWEARRCSVKELSGVVQIPQEDRGGGGKAGGVR
jgi:hypothetical protein